MQQTTQKYKSALVLKGNELSIIVLSNTPKLDETSLLYLAKDAIENKLFSINQTAKTFYPKTQPHIKRGE